MRTLDVPYITQENSTSVQTQAMSQVQFPASNKTKSSPQSPLYYLGKVCGAHASNSSNREAEGVGSLHIQGQPGLQSKKTARTTQTELISKTITMCTQHSLG